MTTLTSSSTLTLTDGSIVTESLSLTVLPSLPAGSGKGRLVHPTLGTYDYDHEPTEWTNMMGSVIIPPIWSSNKTLGGASSTVWAGTIKDVVCEERWTATGGLAMRTTQLAMLLSMYQNPPDPSTAWVSWYPNYATTDGFKVLITDLSVGESNSISLNGFARGGFVQGKVTMKLRIIAKL
jgi:hypothetical protein